MPQHARSSLALAVPRRTPLGLVPVLAPFLKRGVLFVSLQAKAKAEADSKAKAEAEVRVMWRSALSESKTCMQRLYRDLLAAEPTPAAAQHCCLASIAALSLRRVSRSSTETMNFCHVEPSSPSLQGPKPRL